MKTFRIWEYKGEGNQRSPKEGKDPYDMYCKNFLLRGFKNFENSRIRNTEVEETSAPQREGKDPCHIPQNFGSSKTEELQLDL